MADPSTYRPKPGQIPDSPGVYKFRDAHGRVVYVGKAKSLRQRLSSYFQDIAFLHPRTRTMVTTAASVEWTVVDTEVEALQLEYSWIKEFDPRFNVKYRDDKSYPSLAVTLNEEFPRVQVMRGPKRKGVRYFGPYAHAWAIRETVDLLLRVFPVRTCSSGVFKRSAQIGRPCLLGYIGKCSAPCVGRISAEDHRALADEFCDFMAGRTGTYLRRLEQQMKDAASEMEYEKAARLRDDITALKRAMEKNAVVFTDATDADVVAVAEDELEAAVQIFHVRGGRVRGQRGWVTDKVEAVDTAGLVEHALQQLYGDEQGDAVPREVLVPALPAPVEPVAEWLAGRRGSRVDLRIPQRGDKRDLMATVQRNAQQALALHKTRRASDLTTRSRALEEIAEALELDSAPLRIECFDISHLQGDDVVASMVVFEDGLARKSEYRRFQIKGFAGQDDVRSMHEVVTRRFRRYLQEQEKADLWSPTAQGNGSGTAEADGNAESNGKGRNGNGGNGENGNGENGNGGNGNAIGNAEANAGSGNTEANGASVNGTDDVNATKDVNATEDDGTEDGNGPRDSHGGVDVEADGYGRPAPASGPIDPDTGKPRKFAYPPQLVVVDGGRPQVAAAKAALEALGMDDVALCGLAKRLEEVWLPGQEDPVVLPRTSEGLYLLQRVRDEAHRFAISYQRSKRSRSMTAGALDSVPGLGETRRQALLKHFGSLKRLRAATIEQICEVPGIGRRTAEAIAVALAQGPKAVPAVNTATGEIIEEDDRTPKAPTDGGRNSERSE
ncbi:excinuclease ABC subunit UvrC [Wenjunlia tyrosinilytica]|uniref:UvrABC system protein C n=1 Tax=Wenjunlia tyrosinilytica TaxID=1544741 RepID=A0A917ZG98_9ACTN|nr:excinuclease ABC subunit UvrC [Wenjunlia tyrosinilytica]GGO81459.1 UvrABC system protein C [Wenjunlia tyrosinilytica]